tara:strand:- start:362 stop:874 length:513 start_codon:yes stop_codon:yes gene_type:complete
MNDNERIDFIKLQWEKFLKKKIKRDIDISKIESIDEIKKALKIREAVEAISDEFKIDISDEQVVLLSNALISETVIDEKGKIKDVKSREGRPYFFSYDTYQIITKLPFAMINRELIRTDRPEYLENDYDSNEPISHKINNMFEKDGLNIDKNTDSNNIKAYSLADIAGNG